MDSVWANACIYQLIFIDIILTVKRRVIFIPHNEHILMKEIFNNKSNIRIVSFCIIYR